MKIPFIFRSEDLYSGLLNPRRLNSTWISGEKNIFFQIPVIQIWQTQLMSLFAFFFALKSKIQNHLYKSKTLDICMKDLLSFPLEQPCFKNHRPAMICLFNINLFFRSWASSTDTQLWCGNIWCENLQHHHSTCQFIIRKCQTYDQVSQDLDWGRFWSTYQK